MCYNGKEVLIFMFIKTLKKFHLLGVVSCDDTSYLNVVLPEKVKLTNELVRLNYDKYSPFISPKFVTFPEKSYLMLWFMRSKNDASIIIPECYLLFKSLKNRKKDCIYILNNQKINVFIIKNNQLLASYVLNVLDDTLIQLSKDEYLIEEIEEIEEIEVNKMKEESINSLTMNEIYHFIQVNMDMKSISKFIVEKFTYPIVGLIVFSLFVNFIQGMYLESKIKTLEHKYLQEKAENKELRGYIKKYNIKAKKYELFIQNELAYPSVASIMEAIYKTLKDSKDIVIDSMNINGDKMLLRIRTSKSAISYLEKLNSIAYFKEILIQKNIRLTKNTKMVDFSIRLRKVF